MHRDGAQLHPGAALHILNALVAAIGQLPADRPGIRLYGLGDLKSHLLPSGAIGGIAASMLGPDCRPVRAILFDKSPRTNWSLGWHQDRTIVVKKRIPVPGFGPWTVKDGMQHVAPPFSLLARMATLRVHIDPVASANAPLLVALGSHHHGAIAERDIARTVEASEVIACLAEAGDIWSYATPILHASNTSAASGQRRVLQIDYSPDALPGGLEWLGV